MPLGSRLTAVFRGKSRSPSPNPSSTATLVADPSSPPSPAPLPMPFPLLNIPTYQPQRKLGIAHAAHPLPALPLQVIEKATPADEDLWKSKGYKVEALRPSHYLSLRWANENGIPAPVVIARFAPGAAPAGERHLDAKDFYLVHHPEKLYSADDIVTADQLEPAAIVDLVEQLKGIVEKIRARPDERTGRKHGKIGTEGNDDGAEHKLVRLSLADNRFGKVEYFETMTCDDYLVAWDVAQYEPDEHDPTRQVFAIKDLLTPPHIEPHVRVIGTGDWGVKFTHGCLIPEKIACFKDGTIVSLQEWVGAGWWPAWYEAARTMRSGRFDRNGKGPWVPVLRDSGMFDDIRDFWESACQLEIFFDNENTRSHPPPPQQARDQSVRLLKRL